MEEVQDREREQQLEQEVWKEIEEFIISWEPERRKRSATKAENVENDFTEITAKVQELGWKEGKKFIQVLVGTGRGPTPAKHFRLEHLYDAGPGCLKELLRILSGSSWSEMRPFWISVN